MWNGYCGNLIRRANRNSLIVIVCIALLGILFLTYQRQYLTQFFRGASSVDAAQIIQHPIDDQFVRIHIDRALNTGIHHTTTRRGGSKYVDSQYFVMLADEKLLVLRLPGGSHPDEIRDMSFEGRVRPVSAELAKHLENSLSSEAPPTFTYYIDGEDYRETGIITLIIGIPALLFWAWMIWRYLQATGDFARHPFAKQIAKYGQLEMLVQEIDAEMIGAHSTYPWRSNKVEVTQNWLLTSSPFSANAIRLNHLVWTHEYLLKRKLYYFITISKTYFVHAYDDQGKKAQIQLSKDKVDAAIRDLSARVPNAIFGYNDSLKKLWKNSKNDPNRFLMEGRSLVSQTE